MFLIRFMPYQIFFSLGFFYFVAGLILWPLWALTLIPYPLHLHRHLLIWGGLGSFATGFILTSVPCFTGTKTTTTREYQVILGFHLVFLILNLCAHYFPIVMPLGALGLNVALGVFFYRRVLLAKYKIPKAFHLIGLAFLVGLLGNAAGLINYLQGFQSELSVHLETALSYHSTFLILLLGVGSRLFTGIFGLNLSGSKELIGLVTLAFALTAIILECFYPSFSSELSLVRSIALLVTLYAFWNLPYLPRTRSWEANWASLFWLCVWLGFLVEPFAPKALASASHFLFIGGYLGLTLVIASRIILAHGGYLMGNPGPIIKRIGFSFSLLTIGLLLRELTLVSWSLSWVIPVSGLTTLIALFFWAATMIPKIFKRNELILRRGP